MRIVRARESNSEAYSEDTSDAPGQSLWRGDPFRHLGTLTTQGAGFNTIAYSILKVS